MDDGGIGRIIDLRRYPVKSMLGESVTSGDVGLSGLAGDRVRALMHAETGKIASAKYPRRWRSLLTLAATLTDDGVRVTAPDGTVVASTEPDIDDVLTRLVGEPVTLATTPPAAATLDRARPDAVLRDGIEADVPIDVGHLGGMAPAGTFFDFAPLHLITTATLRRIHRLGRAAEPGRAQEPSPAGEPGSVDEPDNALAIRYRPNIVIDWPDARLGNNTVGRGSVGDGSTGAGALAGGSFVEDAWVGRLIGLGDEVVLRVIAVTPRCAIPTLAHGSQPRDVRALRVLAEHHRIVPLPGLGEQPCAGVYAVPVRIGRVRLGDQVRLIDT